MAKTALHWRAWAPDSFLEAAKSRKPVFLWVAPSWFLGGPIASRLHLEEGPLGDLLASNFIPMAVDPEEVSQVPLWYGLTDFPAALVLAPDGRPLASLTSPGTRVLRELLSAASSWLEPCGTAPPAVMALCNVPYIPPAVGNLERGLEVIESVKDRVLGALEEETFSGASPPSQIEAIRFLSRFSFATGARKPLAHAIKRLHTLGHSNLYDAVEGGFFGGAGGERTGTFHKTRTFKLLRHNADWLMLALGLCREREAAFALPMARGILHYLHNRLLLPGGSFGNSQAEDPAYYALKGEERRQLETPPMDETVYTAPNAMVVRALCKGWRLLGEPAYLQQALDAFTPLKKSVEDPSGALAHGFRGVALGEGTLEDTVEMGHAYLALYHSTLEPDYLEGVGRMARRVVVDFKNPAGEGFLDSRLPSGSSGVPFRPVVDSAQNTKASLFLLLASAQLGDESLSAPARGALGALAANPPEDLASLGLLGNALVVALFPLGVYEAITDGSEDQRFRVLERLRQMGPPPAVITHRLPAPREGMKRLPRLLGYCGNKRHEVVV